MKKQIAVTIDKKIYEEFKKYAQENGFSISGRIEALVRNDLKKNKNKLM